jgi:DUF1707 SHOCT-like domain
MTGPGDEIAVGAAGRGRLRASHADREQVIGTLKAAFVQGRLARDEFDLRVGQALASRTYTQLAPLTADLPAGLAATQPRTRGEQPVLRPGPVIAVATALYAGAWGYELFLSPHRGDNPSFPLLIFDGFILYLGILLICAGAILANRRDKRSGGQPPRRPRVGGQASRRLPSPGLGRKSPPAGHGDRHAAEAARNRRPGQRRGCAEAALRAS